MTKNAMHDLSHVYFSNLGAFDFPNFYFTNFGAFSNSNSNLGDGDIGAFYFFAFGAFYAFAVAVLRDAALL